MSGRGATTVDTDCEDHGKLRVELRALLKEALETQAGKEDRAVSAYVQKKCDELYGPTWHCVVGEDFKCAFTHDSKHYMLLTMGRSNVLLYRTHE